jgi:hypothetical protein
MLAVVPVGLTLITTRKVGIDFNTFYAVANLQAQHQDVYSQPLQRAVVSVDKGGEVLYYFHAPQELLLFRPLLMLSIGWAFFAWCVISTTLIAGSVLLLRRQYPDFSITAALALPFPMAVIMIGQDSALILAASVLAFLCFVRKQDFTAGLILSLILIKPQFAIPLVVILSFQYRRVLAGFAVGAIVFLAESLLMVGAHGLGEMVMLGKLENAYEMMNENTNLRGFISLIAGNQVALVIAISVALIALAASMKTDRDKAFSLAVVVCQLVSYHGHTCDMLPLLIPIAVFWKDVKVFWCTIAFTVIFLAFAPMRPSPRQLLVVPLIALLWATVKNIRTVPVPEIFIAHRLHE